MKQFLDENFLLQSKTSQQLYHDFAKKMPVIDYHSHLPPQQIADNINFENLTQAWLYGDHYKWRAMRTNGADESYITGNKSDYEKFEQWAEQSLTLCAILCITGRIWSCNDILMWIEFFLHRVQEVFMMHAQKCYAQKNFPCAIFCGR